MALPTQDVSQLGIFRTKPLGDDGFFVWAWNKFFQALEVQRQNAPQYSFSTHATRTQTNPQNVGLGSIFFETDRMVAYIATPGAWQYLAGIMQTASGGIPGDLGANDNGFLVGVTDFNHMLQWNGTSFTWAPGDSGSGYTVAFQAAPVPLTGWHIANGTTAKVLQSNGNVKSITVPSVAGSYFRT